MLKRDHENRGRPHMSTKSSLQTTNDKPSTDPTQDTGAIVATDAKNTSLVGDSSQLMDVNSYTDNESQVTGKTSVDSTDATKTKEPTDSGSEADEISELSKVKIPGMDDDDPVDDGQPVAKRKTWVTWLVIVIAVLLVAGIGAGVWFMERPTAKKFDNSSHVGGAKIGASSGDSGPSAEPASQESKFMDELGVPRYYQQPEEKVDKATRVKITEDSVASAPANAAMSLASKAANPALTDNPGKSTNEDGTLNPNYSYVTMNNAIPLIRDDLERIVNPVYGEWSALQDPGRIGVDGVAPAFAGATLTDMFDPSVDVGGEEALRKVLPLVADWDRNSYNRELAGKDPDRPVMGVLNDYDCEFNVRGEESDSVTCVATADYSWSDMQGKTHKLGKRSLTLRYRVNYGDPSGRRLLLTSVEQK